MRIGVTGSEGLIGSVLCAALERAGHEARRFDVRNDTRTPHYGDVREPELVAHFVEGCDGGFHDYSHHENKPEKQEPYKKINRWHVAQFASLLDRLAQRREGEGSLLDASMVVLASAMSDGNAHDPHDLPVLLAGRGGGSIAQGRLIASERDSKLCSLWLSMLQRMGVALDRFGDADRGLF